MKFSRTNLKILLTLLLIIIINIFVSLYSFIEKENFQNNNNVKILHLVLYSSDNGPYDKMKMTTEKFYKKFKNVNTIYYKFTNDLKNDIELKDNILHIKGNESYIPGILEKTIKSFDYFKNDLHKYDYIVRSNISTIIRFDILSEDLKNNPVDYGCSLCFGLENTQQNHSETDKETETFSSGTSIILSSNVVKNIVQNKTMIDMDIIDDVSIGNFILNNMPNVKLLPVLKSFKNNGFFIVPNYENNKEKMYELIENNQIVIFRNRNDNREQDADQMKQIVDLLEKKYY